MKASILKERNGNLCLTSANVKRKALCKYLHNLAESAIDIFHGNHSIDDLDYAFIEQGDKDKAFDTACAVLAYKTLSIYGADCEINDEDIFTPLPYRDYENMDSFLCCELAYEYGRQLHYIVAVKAQEEVIDDLIKL